MLKLVASGTMKPVTSTESRGCSLAYSVVLSPKAVLLPKKLQLINENQFRRLK